ncbi:MAG TPA: TIGR03089 family protein [Nocardioidaceae bacterium]|nr:TIGR03089 family protein [Nocardioidaceae bacterium]
MRTPGRSTPEPRAGALSFPVALSALVRTAPSRPLVTFYDDSTGERVELSVATYANWVAKTAGLAQDELDLTRGGAVLLDLPTHWLGAVWLGAAWSVGLSVTDDPGLAEGCDLVVCGPEAVRRYAPGADRVPVLALSLWPLGARFTEALPTGVTDYGAVVLAQPDAFAADDPPGPDDAAWHDRGGSLTQAELLSEAARSAVVSPGGRLVTDVNPVGRSGAATLLAPVQLDAGTVWVRHPDEGRWAARAQQERATDELRA